MKNRGNYLDFRDWHIILAYLKGIVIEVLAILSLIAFGFLLAMAGRLFRR